MKELENKINDLASNLISLFDQYEKIDDIAPLTIPILEDIKKLTANITSQIRKTHMQSINELEELIAEANRLLSEHNKFKEAKLSNLKEKNFIAKDNFEELKDELNFEINNAKQKYDSSKKNKLLDIEFYITSSYQHIEMFEDEYKESINRFNYQIQNAKQSYLDNIIRYNETLEKRINKITKNHKSTLNKYTKESSSIIKAYNASIENIEKEYNEKLEEFKREMITIKENRRNETINLNNQIRGLISVKEQETLYLNQEISEKKNNLIIERENKKKTYQLESQKIARDFVINMNEYDEAFTKIKRSYNETVRALTNRHSMYLINTTKENERDLRQIYSHFDFKELPLTAKQTIKKINRHYQKIVKSHEIATNKELKKNSKDMQLALEKNNYQKKLLDLDRQYALLKLNEIDLKDNKYYQETENSFDAEHRFKLRTIISRYNHSANLTRRESSIRGIKLEALLDKTEATYQQDLEIISSKIKNINLEIDYSNSLKDLVLEIEQSKHQKLVNFLTVSSLLQIEKCKVLNIYNINTYELNILNAKTVLDYSIQKVELQNQKFEAIEHKKLSIEALKLNNLSYNTSYKIQELEIDLNKEYKLNEASCNNEILENSNHFVYEKYRIDLKRIAIFYQLLISYKGYIDELFKNIIYKATSNANYQSSHMDIVYGLLSNTFNLLKNEIIDVIDFTHSSIYQIINERLDFIHKFKFDSLILEKKKAYELELAKAVEEKNKITNQINEINKYIDNNRRALFNLEQAIIYNKSKKLNKDAKKNSKIEKKALTDRYRAIYKMIKNQTKQISSLEKKIIIIENSIKKIEDSYYKHISSLKVLEQGNTIGYNSLYVELDKLITELKNSYQALILPTQFNQASYKEDILDASTISLSLFKRDFEDAIIEFKNTEKKIYDDNINSLEINYKKLILDIEENSLLEHNKAKNNFIKTNNIQLKQIKNANIELEKLKHHYDSLFNESEKNYEKSIEDILEAKKKKLKQFYIELYAIDDNLLDIENEYNDFIKQYDDRFELEKLRLLKEVEDKKALIDDNLLSFIKAKNELIKHLPVGIKLQIKSVIEETRKKNTLLDEELEQEKQILSNKKKTAKKNMSNIHSSHQSRINNLDSEHKKAIAKEKKLYSNITNRIKSNKR